MSKEVNLLRNAGFEDAWSNEGSHRCIIFPKDGSPYEKNVGNIFVPPRWTFWFYHDPGTYDQPEGRDVWKQNAPERVRNGEKAYTWFTFNRSHDAGLFQQVEVGADTQLRFTAWAHAWSNQEDEDLYKCWNCHHGVEIDDSGCAECWYCGTPLNKDVELCFPHPEDGRWSEGAGYDVVAWEAGTLPHDTGYQQKDAKPNFTFQVGIDPTGGTNPLADTVVWGQGYHIYNGYAKQLSVEAEAQSDVVTVFIRSKTLWAFKHNDAYVDDASLTIVEETLQESGRGDPRVQYERTYVLMPPGAGREWVLEAIAHGGWDTTRFTIGGSADDAGIGDLDVRRVIAVNPDLWVNDLEAFFIEYYPGVEYIPVDATLDTLGNKLKEAQGLPFELSVSEIRLAYPSTHLPPVITQGYHSQHHALDFRSSYRYWGDKVLAAYDGVVVRTTDAGDGYGVCVVTETVVEEGTMTLRYAHLVENPPVSVGESISKGQVIGLADNTGTSTGDHLHFDMRVNGQYYDLRPLIDYPEESDLPHIYGVHEDHDHEAAQLMEDNGIQGYIVFTESIGADPNDNSGRNYESVCGHFEHTAIARLNYGYGSSGTIPPAEQYGDFTRRTKNFVANSQGCNIWIIGNEQNNPREWPDGKTITPESFAALFNLCYTAIHEVQSNAIVMPGAVDGYNAAIGYASTEYMHRMWNAIEMADAVCMHAYTHGPDPGLITAETYFGDAPMIGVHYDFLNFTDLQQQLPSWALSLPIYVTETNHLYIENDPNPQPPTFGWIDARTGWIQEMYKFINTWNQGHSQQIRCACLYRWPAIDEWVIHGKQNVIADFVEAMQKRYRSTHG